MVLLKMAAFFVISIIGGFGIKKFFEWLSTYKNPEIERHRRRVPVFALAFCLALAFLQNYSVLQILQVHILQGSFFADCQRDFIFITRLKFYLI